MNNYELQKFWILDWSVETRFRALYGKKRGFGPKTGFFSSLLLLQYTKNSEVRWQETQMYFSYGIVTRAAEEGKKCAPWASWSLVLGRPYVWRGASEYFFLPTSGALFSDPSIVSGKLITFFWTDSSGSSSFVLFLNVILWF